MYSYLTYRERRSSLLFMTSERNLASVSQSWFKLSHSASESKHKNIKKIHTLYYFSNKHNVECENLQHLK